MWIFTGSILNLKGGNFYQEDARTDLRVFYEAITYRQTAGEDLCLAVTNYFVQNQPSTLKPALFLWGNRRGIRGLDASEWEPEEGRLGENSCPNILHADLYSLHPCCY